MTLERVRLTSKEIDRAIESIPDCTVWEWHKRHHRVVANAATEKALQYIVNWLRNFETTHDQIAVLRIGRGHGLDMAAEELEAWLKASKNEAKE